MTLEAAAALLVLGGTVGAFLAKLILEAIAARKVVPVVSTPSSATTAGVLEAILNQAGKTQGELWARLDQHFLRQEEHIDVLEAKVDDCERSRAEDRTIMEMMRLELSKTNKRLDDCLGVKGQRRRDS